VVDGWIEFALLNPIVSLSTNPSALPDIVLAYEACRWLEADHHEVFLAQDWGVIAAGKHR
jgi:hypothetical protein